MDERQKTIVKYLSDMHAVETHIQQAVDKQVKSTKSEPDVNGLVSRIQATLLQHMAGLDARLKELEGSVNPVKSAATSVLGVAAGAIDMVRDEHASRDLRDDYTAINLACMGYTMLHTTALGLKDNQTAELSKKYLADYAKYVMELNHLVPTVVLRELKDVAPIDPSVAGIAISNTQGVWKQ